MSSPLPNVGEVYLTPRELQVLELLSKGHTNLEIAAHLYIAVPTVKMHLRGAYTKTGIRNRLRIAQWYLAEK